MTDNKRPFSNPLALAILVLLYERPMHPYEMATTMRERGKEKSIRLNYGSLYTVIEQLLRENFIAVREVLKEGKRPEKTVYELTPSGEAELIDWMRELVSSPVKEYPMFEAAISLLPVLPPEEVIDLLEIRIGLLQKTIEEFEEQERICREMKLPRLFSLEKRVFQGRYAGGVQILQGPAQRPEARCRRDAIRVGENAKPTSGHEARRPQEANAARRYRRPYEKKEK